MTRFMAEPRILLVNPPLVGGVAFTRQGRCQEREEVLGTTKPPVHAAGHRRASPRRWAYGSGWSI